MKKLFCILSFSITLALASYAQNAERKVVQLSGFALSSDSMTGLPFAHISVRGTFRTTTAAADGFFSLAAAEGDTIVFTYVGFSPSIYIIPAGNPGDKVSVMQVLIKTSAALPTVTVYPWGGKPNFRSTFEQLRLPKGKAEIARENTSRLLLSAHSKTLSIDGGEAAKRFQQQQAAKAALFGQKRPPEGIFSPLAWAEFIKSLIRGDYKKNPDPLLPSHDN